MKKVIISVLSAALLLMGTQAKAQLSVGAGYLNTTETTVNTSYSTASSANLNGFYAGGQYNIPIVAGLGVAPGLYATMLFGSAKDGAELAGIVTTSGTAKYSELALNVPVNVNYAFNLNRDTKLFVYAGPVFQYGLFSKTNTSGSVTFLGVTANSNGTTDNFNGDNASRKPFNVYAGGGVGLQAGSFQVILGYDMNVTNASSLANTVLSRSQIKVGFGMAF